MRPYTELTATSAVVEMGSGVTARAGRRDSSTYHVTQSQTIPFGTRVFVHPLGLSIVSEFLLETQRAHFGRRRRSALRLNHS